MKSLIRSFVAAGALIVSSGAYAIPYFEVGDAGESLATAQALTPGTDQIFGNYTYDSTDLYSFFWSGGAFSVDTFGTGRDTMLFLFNAAGEGVWGADGSICCGIGESQIVDPALAAGLYYLAVGPYDYQPYYSATGRVFNFVGGGGLWTPVPGAVLDHWDLYHQTSGGSYVVNFRNSTAVPEPSMLALFGLGLFGLVARRRRN